MTNSKVIDCIYAAIDEINEDRPPDATLAKAPDTPIHGSRSDLDSLGLVNFVVMVEENVQRELDVAIVLGDDRALSRDPSPFASVQQLADYIEVLLKEQR